MALSLITRKKLWARSGDRCAFPDCDQRLVHSEDSSGDSIIGEEAHIVSPKPNGPRGKSKLPLAERNNYENLILLCSKHHKIIDDQAKKYTVKKLHEFKKQHEQWVEERLNAKPIGKEVSPASFIEYDLEIEPVEIKFYLSRKGKKTLHCEVFEGMESIDFDFRYIPPVWHADKEELPSEDPYFYSLLGLKWNIKDRYKALLEEGNLHILSTLKDEFGKLIATSIEDTARNLFDHENGKHGIPKYDRFIEAFEHYTGLKKGQYTVQPVGHVLIFSTEDEEYEMDCYEGKSHELKNYIDNRSYDEIFTMTNVSIWSDIYLDGGIGKMEFIPRMQSEWEIYWDNLYTRIKKKIGSTSHLDEQKQKSWRQLQTYSEGYNDVGDAIRFAWELDDMVFFPLAVITMMNIFDADTCYTEYCELEFDARAEWESIWVNEEDEDCPVLHIKPHNC